MAVQCLSRCDTLRIFSLENLLSHKQKADPGWISFILILPNCDILHNGALNTLRPRQNGRHFADDTFKCIFLNEKVWIPIKISFKFVPKGPVSNIPALVQIMAWRRSGDKPLSEPMLVRLLTHICVIRSQWVKIYEFISYITCHKNHHPRCQYIPYPVIPDEPVTIYASYHISEADTR